MASGKSFTSKAIVPARVRVEENVVDTSLGIIYFDKDNGYPNRFRSYVNGSGTGRPCVGNYESFIFGNGFKDIRLSEKKINKRGDTLDSMLSAIASDVAYHDGWYTRINYNALFERVSYYFIPYENVRLCVPDEGSKKITRVAIYDDWAKKKKSHIDKDDIEFVDLFDPRPEEIEKQVEKAGGWANYKGQIYANPVGYVLPIYDCVQEDLLTDAGIKTYKLSTVESGFAAQYIYIHKGKKPVDDKGRETNSIEDDIAEMQDPEAGGAVLVVYAEKENQVPELKRIEKEYDDKLHTVTRKSTKDDIIGAFIVPPGLLQATPGKLGTADFNEAVEQYNFTTSRVRLRIERGFKEMFENSVFDIPADQDFSIKPLGGIETGLGIKESLIPNFLVLMSGAGTPEYKFRTLVELFGLDESTALKLVPEGLTKSDKETPLAIQIGVGGTQSLKDILVDPQLTEGQKINSLVLLFGLSKEDATALVKGTDINTSV